MLADADSQSRKETPIFSGGLMYFPDAIALLSQLSFCANEKHNPGEPMHWAKDKSTDHADCTVRHLMTSLERDEFGFLHAVAAFWRAGAHLQTLIDDGHVGRVPPPAEEPARRTGRLAKVRIVNPFRLRLGGELKDACFTAMYSPIYDQWRIKTDEYDFRISPADLHHGYVEIMPL